MNTTGPTVSMYHVYRADGRSIPCRIDGVGGLILDPGPPSPAPCRSTPEGVIVSVTRIDDTIAVLLDVINAWVAEHVDRINGSYLMVRPGRLTFIVLRQASSYDGELEETLTDLDIAIAQDGRFASIPFEVGSVWANSSPPDAIAPDDPDIAAKIADRIRTSAELRSELAEALSLLRQARVVAVADDEDLAVRIDVLLARHPAPDRSPEGSTPPILRG